MDGGVVLLLFLCFSVRTLYHRGSLSPRANARCVTWLDSSPSSEFSWRSLSFLRVELRKEAAVGGSDSWLCEDGARQLGLRWILALPRPRKPGLLPPPVQVC